MDRRKERRILNREALQTEWASNFPFRLRPLLKPVRLIADDPHWWQREPTPSDFLWGGEVAESMTSGVLHPTTQVLYVKPGKTKTEVIRRIAAVHKLRRHPSGPIEVLDSFWSFGDTDDDPAIVPPLLVYADLLALVDPAAAEAAVQFRTQFLGGSTTPSPARSQV